ncbi:MAG: hypothetical protein M0Z99_15865 [Betaproteobacteria bacterium]|nr:hypothetical protein [Betaproteobacteria bacterium]
MTRNLSFHGKALKIECSEKAEKMANRLDAPVVMEMQIYFSCMIGKRLAYYSAADIPGTYRLEADPFREILADAQPLTGKIHVRFNIVMTKNCLVSDYMGPPPVTDFTVARSEAFVPNWLTIDFKDGMFVGEFGWFGSESALPNTRQIRCAAVGSHLQAP